MVFRAKDRFACGWIVFSTKDRFTCVWKVFSTKDRFACVGKRKCGFPDLANFGEDKMARQFGRVAWYRDDFAHCCSSEDYYLDLTREDWTRSGDVETLEQDDNNNIQRLDETADFEVEDSEEFVQMWTWRLDCSRRKNQTSVGRAV
ncbi:hypothetical protein Bbelb_059970 [Branchiostoma belcheri]|nr:hypothetical protein Bbelb_059970 [Branchiostoma belcheri]